MPARRQLILGPDRVTIPRLTADAAAVANLRWLVPTELHRVERRRELSDTARVDTLPGFARRLAFPTGGESLIPESHQRLVLRHVFDELHANKLLPVLGPFANAPGIIDRVFALISELQGLGVEATEYQLKLEQLPRKPYDQDLAVVYTKYREELARHGWRDRAAVYRLAQARLAQGIARMPALYVVGFSDFTPPQLELLQRLSEFVDDLRITLPGDPDDDSELFTITRQTEVKLLNLFPDLELEILPPPSRLCGREAGLFHFEGALFREHSAPAANADGVAFIQAPGIVGEVRLVARAVKTLLLAGISADAILVTARNLSVYAELIAEFFAEYELPSEMESTPSLLRQPAVIALLKAARLPDDGWPFASTAALLRSNFFQPDWPELQSDPDLPADGDLLLRQLGEPRGRDAFLQAARKWAEKPELPLEDEEAEQQIRRRRHELAKRCLPFLERYFAVWDGTPDTASLNDWISWLKQLADRLGITVAAKDVEQSSLSKWWTELEAWASRQAQLSPDRQWKRGDFLDLAAALAGGSALERPDPKPGKVRVVPAELAVGLTYDHLFIIGLGERSFPDLGGPGGLYDEADRQAFHGIGLELEVAAQRLPREMLLFHRLISGTNQSVTFSYPIVDEKGQELLPGSFLKAVQDSFVSGVVPTEKRTIPIQGLLTDSVLSPAEARIHYALTGEDSSKLDPNLVRHMAAVKNASQRRFEEKTFGAFDGLLNEPKTTVDAASRFGSKKVFAPTALEDYVACPFKFFVGRVLKLEALPEPADEIEFTMRGAAYHRALARLHRRVKDAPTADAAEQLSSELATAVQEYSDRAGSPIAKVLWDLELKRLQRSAPRYAQQWVDHYDKWREIAPPRVFDSEIEFGAPDRFPPLTLRVEDVEFRIGGKIDRVDVCDLPDDSLGFWIIDYKTGRSGNFTAPSVKSFQRLQLAVYAMAAETIVGGDRPARPVGLVYWFPTDNGAKQVLPRKTEWLEGDGWVAHRETLRKWLADIVSRIRGGAFPLAPRSEDCTATCEFNRACRIAQSRHTEKLWDLTLPGEGEDE